MTTWFNPADFAGGDSKFLNAKWLKTIDRMACKVRVVGGGVRDVPDFDDKTKLRKEAFLTVESSTGLFEGTKDMPLNKTNMNLLLAGLGKTPASWAGKEIGVFFDPTVKVGPEVKGGLRVKVFEADPFASAPPPPPPAVSPLAIMDDPPF
jgi:hypothetical protein